MNFCDSSVYHGNFQISYWIMHKIVDSLFRQTCKCVCSKWNCLTYIIWFNACHVACSFLTSEQTSAALKFQEPFYCQNCLSKILPFQNVPDIQFAFSRIDHIYSCNLSYPNTYEVHNVHNPYVSTSDMNQVFTKATTNFSAFHLNIRSLAKNFYKLHDFVSVLNKAPSGIAVSETWLNCESAVGTIQLQNYNIMHKPSSTRAGVLVSTYKIV